MEVEVDNFDANRTHAQLSRVFMQAGKVGHSCIIVTVEKSPSHFSHYCSGGYVVLILLLLWKKQPQAAAVMARFKEGEYQVGSHLQALRW